MKIKIVSNETNLAILGKFFWHNPRIRERIKLSVTTHAQELPYNFIPKSSKIQVAYRDQYANRVKWYLVALIAVLIASMGLFAMVALAIAGRTKEIGIRKVLGASEWGISLMFWKEFLSITLGY